MTVPRITFHPRPIDMTAPGAVDKLWQLAEALATAMLSLHELSKHGGDAFLTPAELVLPRPLYMHLTHTVGDSGRSLAQRMLDICPHLVLRVEVTSRVPFDEVHDVHDTRVRMRPIVVDQRVAQEQALEAARRLSAYLIARIAGTRMLLDGSRVVTSAGPALSGDGTWIVVQPLAGAPLTVDPIRLTLAEEGATLDPEAAP